MVEVFKTNVENSDHAIKLIDLICKAFIGFKANFDLEDCDNILRVECANGIIQPLTLIRFLKDAGFKAEVLPD